MSEYAIIGDPISKSLSPVIMEAMGLAYEGIRVTPQGLSGFFAERATKLLGFNITSPLKEAALPYLHELTRDAARLGAVNCVRNVNGVLTGHNTDHRGFRRVLEDMGTSPERALVLGSGGAARAAARAVSELGGRVSFVSRRPGPGRISWQELKPEMVREHDLIVNATPLSSPPLPREGIRQGQTVIDLNYGEEPSGLLVMARQKGALTQDGVPMLLAQHAWNLVVWLGGEPEEWHEKLLGVARRMGVL